MKPLPSYFQELPACPECGYIVKETNRYRRITNKRGLDLLDAKSAKAVWGMLQQAETQLMDVRGSRPRLEALMQVYQLCEKAVQHVGLPPSMEVG